MRLTKQTLASMAFVFISAVMTLTWSCKIDEQHLKDELLSTMQADELLYFSESVQTSEHGSDLNKAAREAARRGHIGVLSWLKAKGADLNRSDAEGWSPILYAAENAQLDTLRYLVEKAGVDVRARSKGRQTALMLACLGGQTDVCRYLLDRGANLNARTLQGSTALMYAAASGKLDLVQMLIESGADKQASDLQQRTALSFSKNETVKNYLSSQGLVQP